MGLGLYGYAQKGGSFGIFARSGQGQRIAAESKRQAILRTTSRARPAATAAPAAPGPSPEIMGLFTEAMKKYQPGGTFGKREEALLGRAKKKYLASGAQSMVSAGLGGTSVPETIGTRFEEEIGEPTRLGLEDVRTSRLNQLLMGKAGYMGGVEAQQFGAAERMRALEFGAGDRMKTLRASLLAQGGGGGGGRSYFGGVDPTGRAEVSPTDIGAIREAYKAKQTAARAKIDQPGFGARQIPEGGRIVGDTYYPPSRFTRNVPQLTL